LLDQVPTMRLLTLVTCRPEFVPPWASRAALAQLTLTRLTRLQAEAMVRGVPGSQALSAEVIRQLVARTDGVPLFVEELTKAVLEASERTAEADRPALTDPQALQAIPVTLQDALRARLDRLAEGRRWHNWGRYWDGPLPIRCSRRSRPWTRRRWGMA
jgi:predicted ATPase